MEYSVVIIFIRHTSALKILFNLEMPSLLL